MQTRLKAKVTTAKLASMSDRSVIAIKRHIAKLGHIRYVGSGFSGHWETAGEGNYSKHKQN